MNPVALQRFANDPEFFRSRLMLPSGRGPIRFGPALADFQCKDFAALDAGYKALRDGTAPAPSRFWIERTKGASKDSDLAVMLLWLLAFCPRPLTCQVGAADQDQADELRKAAKGILRLNPWLSEVLSIQSGAIVNIRTDGRADIIPADEAGSHGARPDLLILNELSHITRQEFALNLLDNLAKVPGAVGVVATNAGFVPSWQYDLRELARTSPRWYFSAVTEPAPWLDPAELAEARKRNTASRYARLWQGQWVRGSGDALDEEDLKAAVNEPGPMTGAERGYSFFAGLDLALKRDHAALVVIGRHVGHVEVVEPEPATVPPLQAAMIENGIWELPDSPLEYKRFPGTQRLRLALVQSWAPPPGGQIDLERVEAAVLDAHRRFRPTILYDPHQCALMAQRLRRQSVMMVETAFSGKSLDEMASAILEQFKARNLDLYEDRQLLDDLARLRLVERSFGYKLEATRDASGHCDRGTALALAVLGARRYPPARTITVDRPLVLWPAPTAGAAGAPGGLFPSTPGAPPA